MTTHFANFPQYPQGPGQPPMDPPPGGGGQPPFGPPPGGGGQPPFGPPPGGGGQPPFGPPPGGGGQPPFGPPSGGSPSAQGGQNPLSIAALVCGILGVLTFWCLLGVPLGIAATVTGFLGRKRAEESGQPTTMATVGLVLGIIALALSVILTIIGLASGSYDFNYSTD